MPAANRVLGCLLGGAVGDALGYPIEFIDSAEQISILRSAITALTMRTIRLSTVSFAWDESRRRQALGGAVLRRTVAHT